MSKITPGPWRVGRDCVVADSGEGCHGDDANREHYGGALVCESVYPANARFIAAAPDMYDALFQWQQAERTGDEQELANARKSRDAAIAEATGEQL